MREKNRLSKTLVIYGRKPVLEALKDPSIEIDKIHLADSNKRAAIIDNIIELAESKNVAIEYRNKKALSYITKNSKQDQGVAADIFHATLFSLEDLIESCEQEKAKSKTLLLLDGVTNPQNLGMIIRSVAASGILGLVLPQQGCADLGPLTIKASAGAVFRCPIVRTTTAKAAASSLQNLGATLVGLDATAPKSLFEQNNISLSHGETQAKSSAGALRVFVLGNETEGISAPLAALLDERVKIPMSNGVESLNVAVAASLVAFFANGAQ